MIPGAITAAHIRRALADIDQSGIPEQCLSRRYELVYQGRRYPPKYVLSLAAKHATGEFPSFSTFSAGSVTNDFLRKLGFAVESRSTPKPRWRPPPGGVPSASDLGHGDRCQACKRAVGVLLERQFGAVEIENRLPIGVTPAAYAASPFAPEMAEIFEHLQHAGGLADLVETNALPIRGYFVPRLGLIVEVDAARHLTAHRRMALSRYPAYLPLGFDTQRWIGNCDYNEPGDAAYHRREAVRAWYDTLRDFVPSVLGLRPTMRLLANEYRWCELSWSSRENRDDFRQILSERAQFWSIHCQGSPSARFGRIAIDGAWSGDTNAARRLLGDVAVALGGQSRLTCLSTCGAFLRFDWPRGLASGGIAEPQPHEIAALMACGEGRVRSVLTDELIGRLRPRCAYLSLGVDTRMVKTTRASDGCAEPRAELICVVDMEKKSLHWTDGTWQSPQAQQSVVHRPLTNVASRFLRLDGVPVLILGERDLSALGPSGPAALGWGQTQITEYRNLAAEHRPAAVIHHQHTTVTARTWRRDWQHLIDELPFINSYAGSFAYSYKDADWDKRNSLTEVLHATQRGEVLNIVVRLCGVS
jgi:hypothetical protein